MVEGGGRDTTNTNQLSDLSTQYFGLRLSQFLSGLINMCLSFCQMRAGKMGSIDGMEAQPRPGRPSCDGGACVWPEPASRNLELKPKFAN